MEPFQTKKIGHACFKSAIRSSRRCMNPNPTSPTPVFQRTARDPPTGAESHAGNDEAISGQHGITYAIQGRMLIRPKVVERLSRGTLLVSSPSAGELGWATIPAHDVARQSRNTLRERRQQDAHLGRQ